MAALPSLFDTFLQNIRPTDQQIQDYKEGHERLRELLRTEDSVSDFYAGDFLQGSYRRSTAVRPIGDEKSDVDIVFVTDLNKDDVTPREAMEQCEPFLEDHYADRWSRKDRAYEIDLDRIEIDLVLTASPSEATKAALAAEGTVGSLDVGEGLFSSPSGKVAEAFGISLDQRGARWKDEPLNIPDRRLQEWDQTHPIATIEWTWLKNDSTDGHYVNIVKAIKWWRRTQTTHPKRPKGYPLEHLVGECCPDNIGSVAEGITRTFETIVRRYETEARDSASPELPARGLPHKNVYDRIDGEDFSAFHDLATEAAALAREALDERDKTTSRDRWHRLLGDPFPEYGSDDADRDEKEAVSFDSSKPTRVSNQRFA